MQQKKLLQISKFMSTTVVEDRFAVEKQRFLDLFEKHGAATGAVHPLQEYQQRAIRQAGALSFPTRRDEEWKYTSINRIVQQEYQLGEQVAVSADALSPFIPEGLDAHLIVFVNGVYQPQLSDEKTLPKGMSVLKLEDALDSDQFGTVARGELEKMLTEREDIFLSLNLAFSQHSLFFHTAKNTQAERPVYILHLAAPGGTPIYNSHLNIFVAEESSEFTVIEGQFQLPGTSGVYFNNLANRALVRPNAHVHHYCLQNEGEQGFVINNTDAAHDRDSTFNNYTIDLGGRIVRNNLNTVHLGSNLTTNYYGIYFGNGEQHIDNHTFLDHAVPHCQSNELYKGIVTDKARGVFNGKVLVRQDAQKTNAFQQSSSLVLSNKAQMDSKPQLEIFADDVRCSHGATIGQLDEDSVFYLRSRGMSDAAARAMLQFAFIGEVLGHFPNQAVSTFGAKMIAEKFGA